MSDSELARIESAFLGIEDHGILTFIIRLEGVGRNKGWSQGIPHYGFDWNPRELDGHADSGYMALAVRGLLEAVGVREWDKLVGKMVYANREGGLIKSIEGVDTGRTFDLSLVVKEPGRATPYRSE